MNLEYITNKVLNGQLIDYEEAVELSSIKDLDELLEAANTIREKFKGNKMDLCSIMNAKSGKCSENCKFCAQSAHYKTGAPEYSLISKEEALKMAKENEENGVHRFSLVTSGKGISDGELDKVTEIYDELKNKTKLQLCASFGIISYEQGLKLKKAGVTMYHHNLETSKAFFPKICDTHTYEDRIETIKNVMKAGLDVCCGGLFGLGETMEDRIKMAFDIRALGIKSVPINILQPIKGTPLENNMILQPDEILRIIAVFRFIIPDGYIRFGGGRKSLGEHQEKGLKSGINAALVGNYLTTIGNKITEDIEMIKRQGLEI
ncbi:biotin synthase [Natranaerovirga pectinivora]|uniref:Biotin synthase n=1 Tax=Natranaerovirga pectinivora TaxID=682400 RepID=A0A4R3MPL5_9FIRM|nr:biotin synthase BioB [Natranaerovirga pectinivora]TCT14215.1 biotin synthase [Natranaerovirga pectinivora]